MRIDIFICCIALNLISFGQDSVQSYQPRGVNPWEFARSLDNPWEFEKADQDPWHYNQLAETPWKPNKSDINPWLGYSGYVAPEEKLTETTPDTLDVIDITQTTEKYQEKVMNTDADEAEMGTELPLPTYTEAMLLGRESYKAGGAFTNAFLWCGMLNILGLPIALVPSFIPSNEQNRMTFEFRRANPGIESEVVGAYKKGIRQKRVRASWGGIVSGVLLNLILIASIS